MTNIVYVSEGFITEQDIIDRKIPEMITQFEDVHYSFTSDLAAVNGCNGDMRAANQRLEKEGPNWVEHTPEFLDSIKDADIIIIHYSGAGKAFFDAAKNLKLLCVMRSGVENVDMEAAAAHGVTVCASPGRAAEPVADLTVTLMLALMRRLPRDNMAGTGKWKTVPMGDEGMMKGATVSLFGFGNIAQRVAKRLRGFDANIIAYDPWANKDRAAEMGVELVDTMEELFERADYLSVHARYIQDGPNCNKGVIDEALLRKMKPTAYIVNTARAGLIDYEALTKVLTEHAIGGAGLDVFDPEPLPDGHPLLLLDNVIVTPHAAGNGGDFIIRSIESPINEIRHYFTDQKYDFKMNR